MSSLIGNDVASFYEYAARNGNFPRFARNFFKAGNVAGLSGAINQTYGALVYDQVNRETNAHSILKKENWERSGFRVTNTSPATKGYGGADPGSVGAVVDYTPQELASIPAFLHSPFDMTLDAGFRARHDDGLDIWEWIVQINRDGHAQLLNEELLRDAEAEAIAIGAPGSADAKNAGGGKGMESLDRFISSKAESDAVIAENALAGAGYYDVYQAGAGLGDRDALTTWDSVVVRPDGTSTNFATDIAFQIKGLDALIDQTEDNGADPGSQVFLTGRDTRRAFYDELATAGRYNLTEVQAKLDYNGLSTTATHPGRDITYTVRAYQDRPIVADKFMAKDGLSRVNLIDQRHMHIKVGFPTLYVDVDNPVIRGQFDTKALFLTCQQTYQTRANVHGKMRSISA